MAEEQEFSFDAGEQSQVHDSTNFQVLMGSTKAFCPRVPQSMKSRVPHIFSSFLEFLYKVRIDIAVLPISTF